MNSSEKEQIQRHRTHTIPFKDAGRQPTGAYNFVQRKNKNSDYVNVVAVFDRWNVECVAHSDKMCHAFNGSSAERGHIYLHQFQMGERDQNMNARRTPSSQ